MKSVQHSLLPYNSTLSGKGALLTETQTILELIAAGQPLADVRYQVLEQNLLSKQTDITRKRTWDHISQRYFLGQTETFIEVLARVATSQLSVQARLLVLFYVCAQSDDLIYDFTVDCLYQLYHAGRSSLEKADVLQWLDTKSNDGHVEIAAWSPQTRSKVASNLLSIARDFGLVEGVQRKEFRRLYIPLPAFLYVLYHQHELGLTGRELVEAEAYKLFFLDQAEVLLLLGEGARQGFLTIRHTANLYDLRLHYGSLSEAMNHVIR